MTSLGYDDLKQGKLVGAYPRPRVAGRFCVNRVQPFAPIPARPLSLQSSSESGTFLSGHGLHGRALDHQAHPNHRNNTKPQPRATQATQQPLGELLRKTTDAQAPGRSRSRRIAQGKAPSRVCVSTPQTVTPACDQGATPSREALRWANVVDGLFFVALQPQGEGTEQVTVLGVSVEGSGKESE